MPHPHDLAIDLAEGLGTALMLAAVIGLAYAMTWPSLTDRTAGARRRRMARNRALVRYLLGWGYAAPRVNPARWHAMDLADRTHEAVIVITRRPAGVAVGYDHAFDGKLDALMGAEEV
jgi:hypothetical protein